MELKYKKKTLSGGSGQELTAGDGVTINEGAIDVDTPVRGVFTQEEYDALSETEKEKGFSVILDESSNGDNVTQEIYSLEERRIGTWIDGKPLYRRVFETISPETTKHDTNILSLDESIIVKKIDGMLTAAPADGSVSPVNFAHDSGAPCSCWFKSNLHSIYMRVGVAVQTNRPVELTLEYTKTTDSPEAD